MTTKKTPTKKTTTKKAPAKKTTRKKVASKKAPAKRPAKVLTPAEVLKMKTAAARKREREAARDEAKARQSRMLDPATARQARAEGLKHNRIQMRKPGPDWPWPLRPYQTGALEAFEAGKRRQGLFWHRRAGKDVFCLSMARNQSQQRVGAYVHFFPAHVQAKRAIWNGVDPKKSARFIDVAFADIEAHRNNSEMFIELANGSTWQLLGSDNYDRLVGSNIVGAFFSEWALCDPRAWDYIRPMIRENNGFVSFITTYRGRNHAWQMAQNLKDNPDWYIDVRSVEQTFDVEGNRIITDADIEAERRDGMSEAMIAQEYYCDPEATSDGAIYGKQIDALRNDPTRQHATWNPARPVYCVWNFDLPVFASYLMIQPGENPTVLACNILNGTTLGEALAVARQQRWPVMQHYVMADQREMAGPMGDLGSRPDVLPKRSDYIITTLTASMLERLRIDGSQCDQLLDAISGYVRRERFDGQTADMMYSPDPVMSWHWRLCAPLESFASWEYNAGDTWGNKPDYSQHDKVSRILT